MKKLPDDPRFKHVDLHNTNLRVTFARIRKEQAEARQQQEATKREADEKVRTLRKKA